MTGVSICANQQLIVTCAADGAVCIRYSSLTGTESAPLTFAHDLESGGASHVTFDACGRHVVSAGADGSVFVYATPGTQHIVPPPTATPVEWPADKESADVADSEKETTLLAQLKQQRFDAAQRATADARRKVQDRLSRLKEHLENSIEQNAQAPELERVKPEEFIIDRGLVEELKADGERRCGPSGMCVS